MAVKLTVFRDHLGIANTLANAVTPGNDRAKFVQDLMNASFTAAGSRYNVMIFKTNITHRKQLNGLKFEAVTMIATGAWIPWPHEYNIWVFQDGDFTNQGDGGWINWGFKGWFERNGGYVLFRNPYAVQEAEPATEIPQGARQFEQPEEEVPQEVLVTQTPTP
jgi:hypothetical protein